MLMMLHPFPSLLSAVDIVRRPIGLPVQHWQEAHKCSSDRHEESKNLGMIATWNDLCCSACIAPTMQVHQ